MVPLLPCVLCSRYGGEEDGKVPDQGMRLLDMQEHLWRQIRKNTLWNRTDNKLLYLWGRSCQIQDDDITADNFQELLNVIYPMQKVIFMNIYLVIDPKTLKIHVFSPSRTITSSCCWRWLTDSKCLTYVVSLFFCKKKNYCLSIVLARAQCELQTFLSRIFHK